MKKIGKVCNYYGGVVVQEVDGKYYWTIKNYSDLWQSLELDECGDNPWEEIPESLYSELIKFNKIVKHVWQTDGWFSCADPEKINIG